MSQEVRFDRDLIERYDVAGPRYTSYPTAIQFQESFDEDHYKAHVAASNDDLIPAPLSVYVHLPFCQSLCYYCACTKKVTRHPEHGVAYLERLRREIALQGELFDADREVVQLHLGGGTPTFMDDEQLAGLMADISAHFKLSEDESLREFSVEIDPRTVDPGRLAALAAMGYNRISLGVQDFDPAVQQAVNRVQDPELTLALVEAAREIGFQSVSFDLIYGLPLQSEESFGATLDRVIEARPDRLAVYNYAHLPQIFRAQRLINADDLPPPEAKLRLMELTIARLVEAGYVYIGMDHFALPEDELCEAQRRGELHRNFQGYSTHAGACLIGLGVSAIGKVRDCFVQNLKLLPQWNDALDANRLPIWRGMELSPEDRLRAAIIQDIMCHGKLEFERFERRYGFDFADFFALELNTLQQQAEDGLIRLDEDGLEVTPEGRLLLRAIAMPFDQYLPREARTGQYSRVI